MKKLIFVMTALILLTVAGIAAWQVYVPVHEDNVSVNAYEDLRQFARIPTPEPTIQPDTSSSPGTTPAPILEPEPTLRLLRKLTSTPFGQSTRKSWRGSLSTVPISITPWPGTATTTTTFTTCSPGRGTAPAACSWTAAIRPTF